jgi:CubicO group peptidase (beta-lactamase class C family)
LPAIRRAELDSALSAAVEAGRVPGVAAVVTDASGVVYEGAFGAARLGSAAAMRVDTVCRIASMTKLVTSIAVLMLRDEGLIDLDEPFARYLPGYRQPPVLVSFDARSKRYTTRPARSAITVRQLLSHTSGYGYWFLDRELLALHTGQPEYYNPPFLMHEPGSRFAYGVSTDVLGQCIEPLTGLPLARFFAERIFAPLGMTECSFSLPQERARLAAVHALTGDGFRELPIEDAPEGPRGGGALYATAREYAALLRMLLRDGRSDGAALLRAASVRELEANQLGSRRAARQTTVVPERTADFVFMDGTQEFGLGVLIETRDRPTGRHAGSYGWGGIFNTYFWVDRAAGLGAVMFMQVSPFAAPECLSLCDALEERIFLGPRPNP